MWNLLIRDVKIDAYTLMLNPTILITTFKLLLLILFTDICWVIEIEIKELAKNETPEYYEELKYEIQPLKPMILHTHTHTHTQMEMQLILTVIFIFYNLLMIKAVS